MAAGLRRRGAPVTVPAGREAAAGIGAGALTASVAVTLLVQTLVSLCALSVPVLAPEIAADRRLDPALIGFYPAFMYSAALFLLLHSPRLLDRLGPMGLSVACVVTGGCGLALFMVPLPSLALCVLGTFLIGSGYGPVTPASSQILSARVPPRFANLIFSIKQTGVPLGGVIAGALIPTLIHASSWRTAGLIIGLGSIATGIVLILTIPVMDRDHVRSGAGARGFLEPLRALMAIRVLRNLALASMTFAAMQLCLNAFLTVFLVEGVGLSLVEAGALFAITQTASIVGRVLWGVVADRLLPPTVTMVLLAILMAGTAVVIGWFTRAWPTWLMAAVCLVHGASASGWVGLVLSEIARHAPAGQTGVLTAAAQSIMFIGVLIGPLLFSAVLTATGSFQAAFVAIALFTLLGGWMAVQRGGHEMA